MATEALQDREQVYKALTSYVLFSRMESTEKYLYGLRTPLLKVASPNNVATQIVSLASPRLSGHVTGQVLMVNGGFEGRRLNTSQDIDKRVESLGIM